jgi:superkiller protein 3
MQLAMLLQRTGRVIEALRIYQQLCQSQPETALHHFNLGNVNMMLKRYVDAERAYKKVIELQPERGDGYRALAQCYLVGSKDAVAAASLAREAVKRDPTAPVYVLLGEACARAGDLAAARDAWRRALELDPDNAAYQRRYDLLQQER